MLRLVFRKCEQPKLHLQVQITGTDADLGFMTCPCKDSIPLTLSSVFPCVMGSSIGCLKNGGLELD